jgi:predicted secreted protein
MAVTLGKDITITGVSNARSFTVTNTANEVDVTAFGDTSRRFRKTYTDLTVEVECVDDPGVAAGDTFTLTGPSMTGSFIVTSVAEEAPIDGIITYTVSAASN